MSEFPVRYTSPRYYWLNVEPPPNHLRLRNASEIQKGDLVRLRGSIDWTETLEVDHSRKALTTGFHGFRRTGGFVGIIDACRKIGEDSIRVRLDKFLRKIFKRKTF